MDYLSRPDIVERLVKYTVESADLAEEIEEKGDEFLMGKYSFMYVLAAAAAPPPVSSAHARPPQRT